MTYKSHETNSTCTHCYCHYPPALAILQQLGHTAGKLIGSILDCSLLYMSGSGSLAARASVQCYEQQQPGQLAWLPPHKSSHDVIGIPSD